MCRHLELHFVEPEVKEVSVDHPVNNNGGEVGFKTHTERVYYCIVCGEIQEGVPPDVPEEA